MSAPQSPDAAELLRAEIAATRQELGQTVAALAAKTDVKARTKEGIAETANHVKLAASSTVDRVKQMASEQARSPVPWAVIGAVAGAVVGWIWWRRRR